MKRLKSKYRSEKTTIDGITFDSRKEAERYQELKLYEKAGMISDLQRQVKYILIPTQYEVSTDAYKIGIHAGENKRGKLLERECAYIADFQYIEGGKFVVEDVKGVRTPTYIIKRKLMLHKYGIRIKEI